MTAHQHQWMLEHSIPLGLVDTNGHVWVWRCWICSVCQVHCWSDGLIRADAGPMTPLEWETHAQALRGQGLRPGQRRVIEGG